MPHATDTPSTQRTAKETKITSSELRTNADDIVNRVYEDGERFVVERDGVRMATIVPDDSKEAKPGITWGEFLALLRDAPRVAPDFAADIEAIKALQPKAEFPEWLD